VPKTYSSQSVALTLPFTRVQDEIYNSLPSPSAHSNGELFNAPSKRGQESNTSISPRKRARLTRIPEDARSQTRDVNWDEIAQARPAESVDIIPIGYDVLLQFLQTLRDKDPNIHFQCPWVGTPSMNIEFTAGHKPNARVMLSWRLCEALLIFQHSEVKLSVK
jgi:hypothetical protein